MKGLLYSYPKEYALWSGALAWLGVALNSWVGGWDQMLKGLVILMWVDFVTGILASIKGKTTNSHTMFWGGVNKILVIVFVGVGVAADGLMLSSEPYIRTSIVWFYLAREGLSIVENYGKLGLPLPSIVTQSLEQLGQRADGNVPKGR